MLGVVDEVLPIEARAVLAARDVVLGVRGISARAALHATLMRRHRIASIRSFDRGFDAVPGIRRMS